MGFRARCRTRPGKTGAIGGLPGVIPPIRLPWTPIRPWWPGRGSCVNWPDL